jgi:hypothetical protein
MLYFSLNRVKENQNMASPSQIFCFRANYPSKNFDENFSPDWLTVTTNWQGYRISTVPWIADVARILGLLDVEDTPEAWKTYLESLGLQDIKSLCCEEFFEDRLFTL